MAGSGGVPELTKLQAGLRRRTEGEGLQAGGPALHTASHAGARGPGRGGARACTAEARPALVRGASLMLSGADREF